MDLPAIAQWIQNGAIGTSIRQSEFGFPTIETCHVLSIVTVVGSITMLDLRLLGVASGDQRVSELISDVLPWTWSAFVAAVITGGLLFTSKAFDYYNDGPFRAKMVLLVFAGLNMGIFEIFTKKGMPAWDQGKTPLAAKIAGGLSLALWISIIFCGRWIGFTTS